MNHSAMAQSSNATRTGNTLNHSNYRKSEEDKDVMIVSVDWIFDAISTQTIPKSFVKYYIHL